MATVSIGDLLSRLRSAGGDTADIEVKSAAGGLPQTLTETLCGLANLPGGGWVVLGLDEQAGFAPVRLGDLQTLKQGLASKARSCTPPVVVDVGQAVVDGLDVIVARVAECARSAKPCRVAGQGWVRSWDGDYRMSELEEQAFLRHREPPRFDCEPVTGAHLSDLDPNLVGFWSRAARENDPGGLGRFTDDDELLVRAGVVTDALVPSRAGLLALGIHPQQFFPRFVVNLSAADATDPGGGVRAREPATLSGPIPVMLEGALEWARKVFLRSAVEEPDGSVRDRWQYPLEAVRELVANALVHRDLDAWAQGMAVEVRLTPDRFVVTNPGGLYGITTDRLGRAGTTSARNGRLIEICRYARTSDGGRVVETLASGIPRVLESLREAKLPVPLFQDTGIRFTVVLQRNAAQRPAHGLTNSSERAVLLALAGGPVKVAELEQLTGLKAPTIRRALRGLAARAQVEQIGGRGQVTTYRRMTPLSR